MKKFFSLVLALVMALSLTTVAWGATNVTDQTGLEAAIAQGGGEIVLAAGNYTMPQDNALKGKTLTISGPKGAVIDISAVVTNGSQAFTGTTLVFDGVTINCASATTNYKGFTHAASLTYKNCDINGYQYLYASNVVFDTCTFTSTGYSVCTYGAENVTFTGCTFNTEGKCLLIYKDDPMNVIPVVKVENCIFNASQSAYAGAIKNQPCAAIEIHNYATGVNLTTSGNTIDSDFSGEWRTKQYDAGGAITVNDIEYTTIALDGNKMTIDGNKNVTVLPPVAKIGNVNYYSLAEAVAAADSGDTIVMYADCDEDVTVGKEVTINPNGHAVTVKAAANYQVVKNTAGAYVVTAAVTFGDKFDLYLANADMNTALKLKTPTVAGLSFTEVAAKTNKDGSGNVAYIAANNGQFFVKTTNPTVADYAVTYAGKTDVLYYVTVAGTNAANFMYDEEVKAFANWGMKCGQINNTGWTTAQKAEDYFMASDYVVYMAAPAGVGTNYLLDGVVVSGVRVGTTIDHHFVASNFKYDAATGANVPTSAICTTCTQTTTAIYKIGKAPANAVVKPLYVDGVKSTIWEVVPAATSAGGAVVTPSTDKVTSAETFDAGIAMYVGMSVMAAAGSAVVIGKKKD